MKSIFALLIILTCFLGCRESKNNLYDQKLNDEIANAKISNFDEIYFVGNHSGIPAIYRYDAPSEKVKLFWGKEGERVIDLLVSRDQTTAYFITMRKQRLKSSKPAFEKGRLYRIDFDANKVESIAQLEEAIQIIPFWQDDDRFTLVINSVDKTVASYINKNTQVYNKFGKLLSDNNEIFDITKDGYPMTKLPDLKLTSPNKIFSVIIKDDSLQIKQNNSGQIINTKFVKKEIRQINWAENNKNVIILLVNKTEELKVLSSSLASSTLIIFDLFDKKIIKAFEHGLGYKSFVLIGDFLIFDNGFGRDSSIKIIELSSLEEVKTIKIAGGCGLRKIPGI
jgi:hypothetical protein